VKTLSRRRAADFFTTCAKNITTTAAEAGVGRLICVSTYGAANPDAGRAYGYYAAKAARGGFTRPRRSRRRWCCPHRGVVEASSTGTGAGSPGVISPRSMGPGRPCGRGIGAWLKNAPGGPVAARLLAAADAEGLIDWSVSVIKSGAGTRSSAKSSCARPQARTAPASHRHCLRTTARTASIRAYSPPPSCRFASASAVPGGTRPPWARVDPQRNTQRGAGTEV